MALTDSILATSRILTTEVRIYAEGDGVGVLISPLDSADAVLATGTPGFDKLTIKKSYASPVPVLALHLNRVPIWIHRGLRVTVDVGYDGETRRLFSGFVQDRQRGFGAGTVVCLGKLWTLFRTIEIGDRNVNDDTVEQAIIDILDYVGIADYALTIPDFTMGQGGNTGTAILQRSQASQMLATLMDIDGCMVTELGTGQVGIRVVEQLPAPTSFKTYTTDTAATARVLDGSDKEDPAYFRDRILGTGATIIEGTPPNETSRTLTATATLTGDKVLVQPPLPDGTFIDSEPSNHLIDTDDKLAEYVNRMLVLFARIPRTITLDIAGDPQLELGQTLTFTIPELDLDDALFVAGIEHIIDESGYRTRLIDLTGAGDTGGTISQNPIAAFTFHAEREVYDDGVALIATLDASDSFDPDGTIVSYAWSDNQAPATTPSIDTATDKKITIRADTSLWVGTWDVTLTVTDNDGLTHSVTISVPYENDDAEIVIPAMAAAMGDQFSASGDGGLNWNDQTGNGAGTVKVAMMPPDGQRSGLAVFGQTDGQIYRTDDLCISALSLVHTLDAEVADIEWDWRTPGRVWALDVGMKLYLSSDYGVNWSDIADFATEFGEASAIGRSIGLPGAGGVWVWGGDGAGTPMFGWFVNGATHRGTLGGELADDSPGLNNSAAIVDAVDFGAGIGIILENYDASDSGLRPAYFATSPHTPSGWERITGMSDPFTTDGVYIMTGLEPTTFHLGFADRDIHHVTAAPAQASLSSDVLPAGFTPNAGLAMGDVQNGLATARAYLIAAEDAGNTGAIYKSADELESVGDVRPAAGGDTWPASADGKDIAIGAPGISVFGAAANLALISDFGGATTFDIAFPTTPGLTNWTVVSLPAEVTHQRPRPICLTNQVWFVSNHSGFPNPAAFECNRQMARSIDGGLTWGLVPGIGDETCLTDRAAAGDEINHLSLIARGADGTLWAARQLGSDAGDPIRVEIYKSTDAEQIGDTWSLSKLVTAAGDNKLPTMLLTHPTNKNIIAMIAVDDQNLDQCETTHTRNRGATWTTHSPTAGSGDGFALSKNGHANDAMMLPTGRIVLWNRTTTADNLKIYTSDDYGETWQLRYTDAHADEDIAFAIHQGQWKNAGQHLVALRVPVQDGQDSHMAIVESLNSATTWGTPRDLSTPTNLTLGNDTGGHYDPATDTIFFINGNRNSTDHRIWRLNNATNGGDTWVDVSGDLPDESVDIKWAQTALIPAS